MGSSNIFCHTSHGLLIGVLGHVEPWDRQGTREPAVRLILPAETPKRLRSRVAPQPQPPIDDVEWPEQVHAAVVLPPPRVRLRWEEIVKPFHVVLISFGVAPA